MSNNSQRLDEAMKKLDSELKRRDRAEKAKPLSVALAALAVIVVIAGGIWFAATRGGDDASTEAAASSTENTPTYTPLKTSLDTPLPETVSCEYPDSGQAARPVSKPKTENVPTTGDVTVTLNTNDGPIPMKLDRSVSPCTVNAIEHLAKEKYYDNTQCHRITTSGIHVLQCGDPSAQGTGGPGFSFKDEFPVNDPKQNNGQPIEYPRGSIAMANSGPDTNGSQFFLNYAESPLPASYTYFGQVTDEGLKTLDTIASRGAAEGASDGKPAQDVIIATATVS
ncbi:peptidylprolyl isomerase [Corynebacterium aquilae]|uniref:Isomerase n=1 Tax=Corynebacterium aquilae DSM 44791 TaxID=1431546 RepID=A0A1L7CGB6_9CORY|nr:peptidylprolyl isomerase [Corynebacterium aquilae]APT84865.1 isomerase [Corynebacterium aquilae DSM 44791]